MCPAQQVSRGQTVARVKALTYAVPALLIGFFLFRGRKDPVYILAIPLLLACGRSIFLNLYSLNLHLGGGLGVGQEDVMLIALIVVVIYLREIRPTAKPERLTLQLYLCIGMLLLLTAKVFADPLLSSGDQVGQNYVKAAVDAGENLRVYFYLPLSVMLWRDVLKRFSRREIRRLLGIITWVTTACGVVYLADLAGLPTYTRIWIPYATIQAASGTSAFRDYLTLPFWLDVALGYSLAHLAYGKQRATFLVVGLLVSVCTVFSFTRAFILCALGLWVVAGFWMVLVVPLSGRQKVTRSPMRPARAFVFMSVGAAGCGVAVLRRSTLSGWWAYLGQRMSTLSSGPSGDRDVSLRLRLFSLAASTVARNGALLGVSAASTAALGGIYYLDSYWAAVLVTFGWLGLLVVGGLVLAAIGKIAHKALRGSAQSDVLSLALLLGLLMAIGASITNAGFAFAVAPGAFLLAAADVRNRAESRGPDLSLETPTVPERT